MIEKELYIGKNRVVQNAGTVSGEYVVKDGETFYKIDNYDQIDPFFMTLVSGSDHWLFISSNGALSAGRKNSDSALFPYYTDDKITDSAEITGSKSIFRVHRDGKWYAWEPFSDRFQGAYAIQRNLYKNRLGNKLIFEEINNELSLKFSYSWSFSDRYGFVKTSALENLSTSSTEVEILDGIQNILPYGVNEQLQNTRSTLVDAYRKSELETGIGIGIFSLSSMIVDKAEPSEALKASVVYSLGLEPALHLLCSKQLDKYRAGGSLEPEEDVRAERGGYFLNSSIVLDKNSSHDWYLVADVNQSLANINLVKDLLNNKNEALKLLKADLIESAVNLEKKIAGADGLQLTNNLLATGRHQTNVLFNIMRGGTFEDQYEIDLDDFREFLIKFSPKTYSRHQDFLKSIPDTISYQKLYSTLATKGDFDLSRCCLEYLPLSFSRRHGDPSRPWNKFNINAAGEKEKKILSYEGNWRDIFQNWEALAISFPEYLEGMLSKFVNASTIDGYNPYRITREGVDWEVIEPDDPWSFIGYWGDHQIIYLLKLLELSNSFNPGAVNELLTQDLFVYANVPYRIKDHNSIIENASDTIDFDHTIAKETQAREAEFGSDGKLVFKGGDLVRANFIEKILVTVLTKLYNFIPEAGIWLNTQRPEWNDANNALVGNGTSMVTLYYLRRFFVFGLQLLEKTEDSNFKVNRPIKELLGSELEILTKHESLLEARISDQDRRIFLDEMGLAGEKYRTEVYSLNGVDEKKSVAKTEIESLFKLALNYIDHSIAVNKREDGLYHAYNLIKISQDKVSIDNLYEMLEGQVAVLSSGYLSPAEVVSLLDKLKASKLFRADQFSYLLYPDRELARFEEKNIIEDKFIRNSKLASVLMNESDTSIFCKDVHGQAHFNGDFHNAEDLKDKLDELALDSRYEGYIKEEYQSYLEAFESIFRHRYFTGRSGTFYGYEGLGSIYWHMVSKLLLATQENIWLAIETGASKEIIGGLISHYYEIRAGIGINKSPDLYGGFPTDAYSHTPGNAGVQQPGMTGQVKEDILNRWAELGVHVNDGQLSFAPAFLQKEELLKEPTNFKYYDTQLEVNEISVDSGSLVFTYCQVPVTYTLSDREKLVVKTSDGSVHDQNELTLTKDHSNKIFQRNGEIIGIDCYLSLESYI